MGGRAFIPLKTGRSGPKSASYAEGSVVELVRCLVISLGRG